MKAFPHFCSNLQAHLRHPGCNSQPAVLWTTAQDLAGSKRQQGSEARLEQRVNARGAKSSPGGYFLIVLQSDEFSKNPNLTAGEDVVTLN